MQISTEQNFNLGQHPFLAPCSLERGELTKAFAKARQQFKKVTPNRKNTFNNSEYADFDAVTEAVIDALSANDLAVWQPTAKIDGELFLITELSHASGQFIRGFFPLQFGKDLTQADAGKKKSFDQEIGKTWTYLKRYALMSLLGISVDKDSDDDDGQQNAKIAQNTQNNRQTVEAPKVQSAPPQYISNDQHDILQEKLQGYPKIAESLLKQLNIATLKQMPRDKFKLYLDQIDVIIKRQESITV